MTDIERRRLARILGMLGSDHAGERAAAGLQAEAFRKRHGLTWEELIRQSPMPWARPWEQWEPKAEPTPAEPPVWTPPPPSPPPPPPPDTRWSRRRASNAPERLKALVYVVVMVGGAVLINVYF